MHQRCVEYTKETFYLPKIDMQILKTTLEYTRCIFGKCDVQAHPHCCRNLAAAIRYGCYQVRSQLMSVMMMPSTTALCLSTGNVRAWKFRHWGSLLRLQFVNECKRSQLVSILWRGLDLFQRREES